MKKIIDLIIKNFMDDLEEEGILMALMPFFLVFMGAGLSLFMIIVLIWSIIGCLS